MSYSFINKAISEALYDAFQAEPFYCAIAQARNNQTESEQEALLKYFDFSIQESKKYGIVQTLSNPSIGASLWQQPQSKALGQAQSLAKKAFLKTYFGEDSLAKYTQMATLMNEKEKGIIGANYWYLSILAVAKEYQGKGFGRQLLNPVLAQADIQGVPTYLETFTEVNLIFYGKLGYKVVREYIDPTLDKTCWILVRPPQ